MSDTQKAAVPGVTTRLIRELEKIVEARQESVKTVRERFGFAQADKLKPKQHKATG